MKCYKKLLHFFMKFYFVLFHIMLISDIPHVIIWIIGFHSIDALDFYRTIIGFLAFISFVLFIFLIFIPLCRISKIDAPTIFQEDFDTKTKLIYYSPIVLSLLSFFARCILDFTKVIPFENEAIGEWGFATANSIISVAGILHIRWYNDIIKK